MHEVITMPAWFSNLTKSEPYAADIYERDPRWELSAGDRIAPLRTRGTRKWRRRGGLVALLAASGGWYAFGDPGTVPASWRTNFASLASTAYSTIEQRLRGPAEEAKPDQLAVAPITNALADSLSPLPSVTTPVSAPALPSPVPPLGALIAPAAKPVTTAAVPLAATNTAGTKASTAYVPAAPPATDSYQKRAEAAGLHPDLSRALLEQLSATDYRNAETAIKTALAETSDGGAFSWPRHRKPGLALFEVRFVPGAATDCRRYVVSIVKDRWSTTAMPIEKCGVQRKVADKP
jgi:surface antigen